MPHLNHRFALAAAAALIGSRLSAQQRDTSRTEPQGPLSVTVEAASHHFGTGHYFDGKDVRPFNNFNPGIGWEYRVSGAFYIGGGIYRNSFYRAATYGVVGYETPRWRRVGLGAQAGLVTGYNDTVMPAGLPYAVLDMGRIDLKLFAMPRVRHVTPPMVTAQFRVRLD